MLIVQTIHKKLNNGVSHVLNTLAMGFSEHDVVTLTNEPEKDTVSLSFFKTFKLYSKADLIISHSFYRFTWLLLFFSLFKPVIFYRHGSQKKFLREFLIFIFRGIRVAVSENAASLTIKSHVIYPPAYSTCEPFPWNEKKIQVVFGGGFRLQKGIDLFAAAALQYPEVQFFASGGGNLRPFAPNLTYLEFLPKEEFQQLLSESKVLVVPSRKMNGMEGCPVVATEGLLMGCHVVGSSDLPVVEALGGVNGCGTIFKEGDIESLVNAISVALKTKPDPNKTKLICQRHSVQFVCQELLRVSNVKIA